MTISELKEKNITELTKIARQLDLPGASGLRKQDLIRSVLNARAGAMKFACRLRGELAKGVTIAQRMNCFKNQFRPHDFSSCRMNDWYSAQAQSSYRQVLAAGTDLLPAAGDHSLDALRGVFGSFLCAPRLNPHRTEKRNRTVTKVVLGT